VIAERNVDPRWHAADYSISCLAPVHASG
jgi:hypothetical protein